MRNLTILLVLPLAIGVYFFFSHRSASQKPDTPPSGSPGFSVADPSAAGPRILLEAEDAAAVQSPASTSPADLKIATTASSGKCAYIGPDKWNELWKKGKVEGNWDRGHPKAANPGFVRWNFDCPGDGDFEIWVRAYWVDDCANSVALVFGEPEDAAFSQRQLSVLSGTTFRKWTWNRLVDSELEPKRIRLKKGRNVLTLCNREDDVYVDQVLLRDVTQKWPDPTGIEKP